MKDKRVLTDGDMTIELYLLRGHPHAVGLLMAYLPKQKLLIQADSYIPRPGAPPLPAPSPYTINLVDNVARLKLDVARVVHIHGGVSPYSDLIAAAGRSEPAVSTSVDLRPITGKQRSTLCIPRQPSPCHKSTAEAVHHRLTAARRGCEDYAQGPALREALFK